MDGPSSTTHGTTPDGERDSAVISRRVVELAERVAQLERERDEQAEKALRLRQQRSERAEKLARFWSVAFAVSPLLLLAWILWMMLLIRGCA